VSDRAPPCRLYLTVPHDAGAGIADALAAAGIVFIAIGFALSSGVWAGMLPIWGFALVVIGIGAYAFTSLSQRGTKG
jgi:hypothetical protein